MHNGWEMFPGLQDRKKRSHCHSLKCTEVGIKKKKIPGIVFEQMNRIQDPAAFGEFLALSPGFNVTEFFSLVGPQIKALT